MPPTIEHSEQSPITGSAEPKDEGTINAKPTEPTSAGKEETIPQLRRNETMDSLYTDNAEFVQRGTPRPVDFYDEFIQPNREPRAARRIIPPPRRYNYSPSPQRWRAPPAPIVPMLHSSTQLLEQLNYDGMVDVPFPGKSSIYLTTFPFTDKDMKEWVWLFRSGIEDEFLHKRTDLVEDEGDEEDDWYPGDRRGRSNRPIHIHHGRRNRSPIYIHNTADIPSVYLSRALDPTVIPESSEKEFTYVIVVRNRGRVGGGAKLLTAGSRKAAGILIYYEALIGNSVAFVGALKKNEEKGKKGWKYKQIDSVDEAVKVTEEGVIGVLC